MKTNLRIMAVTAVLVFLAFSCSKDKDKGVPFSQKSVEENKAVVENSAIDLAKTMDEMKDVATVDAAVSLSNLLDMSDPFASTTKSSKLSMVMHAVAGLQKGPNTVHALFTAMKSPAELKGDPQSIQEAWDQLVGIYNWNAGTESWDEVANSTKIQFNFPSTEGGSTNDASLTVSNYTGVTVANPVDEDYTGDLPASLNIELKKGTSTLMTYVFAAQYNTEGVPSKVASTLTIETFVFAISLTNNTSEISANYSFKHGTTTVMEIGGGVNGDFSQANIDANTETKTDTWTWTDYVWNDVTQQYDEVLRTETDEWTEVHGEEIAQSGHAHFQVFNIALNGTVNIRSLVNEREALYPDNRWDDPNFNEQEAATKEAALMNKYMNIYAMDVKANAKIAQAEAYVVTDEYYPGEFDYYADMRLKFGDGSYVDMATYFQDGFGDFIAEINTTIEELNAEYNWAIEPIEYGK